MPHPVSEYQRVDGAELQRGRSQRVYGADDREDADRKCYKADADIIGNNIRRSDRRLFVQILPPFFMIFDLLDDWARQVSEVGEIFVAPGRKQREERYGDEAQKDRERIARSSPKDRGEIIKVEVQDGARALRFVAIDQPVRANDKVVQVIDYPLVARFDASDGQVGGGPPVTASKFTHLFATQTAQPARRMSLINQLLQPLPTGFAFLDKVFGHFEI